MYIHCLYYSPTVTDPPNFKAGETETKVKVPALAANSEVGFTDTLGNIDEGRNQLACFKIS
jgi:hypothetical protein